MKVLILFEHASGYALIKCKCKSVEEVLQKSAGARENYAEFSNIFKLHAFSPFVSAANALENCNAISEGVLHDDLKTFLLEYLPKEDDILVCVAERKLAESLKSPETDISVNIKWSSESSLQEFYRVLRIHFSSFISGFSHFAESKAQIGLGHSYSRAKVKFNVHRQDNMIIQTINLLDQMDKDINTFTMRVKEWFSYHFPELYKIVPDSSQFIKIIGLIKSRDGAVEENIEALESIVNDADKAKMIVESAKTSVGFDITEADSENLSSFTSRILGLIDRRAKAHEYLIQKLDGVAPNLSTLIGTQVSARLIAHAGSLTNLAKFPASTIQILGAEKALFRALKTRGNTPKYGLIYHSPFIGRAARENKGRISRFLAAKCAIASRVDCFSEVLCGVFGKHMRQQVEDRLSYFETGVKPITNAEAMAAAVIEAQKVVRKLKKKAINTIHMANLKREGSDEEQNYLKTESNPDIPNGELTTKKKKKKRQLEEQQNSLNEVKDELKPYMKEEEEDGVNGNDVGEPLADNVLKKEKKKKDKKKLNEDGDVDVKLELVDTGEYMDDFADKASAKKKKKSKLEETHQNGDNASNVHINGFATKRSRSISESLASVDQQSAEAVDSELASPTKKKKKRSHSMTEPQENDSVAVEVGDEAIVVKKKKKKHMEEHV